MAPRKKSNSKLGHDPLAWLDDESAETEKQPAKKQASKVVEEEQVVEPKEPSSDVAVDEVSEVVETEPVIETDKKTTGDSNMMELPMYFGIAQVAEVHEQLKQLMQQGSEQIEIKADDIENIDTAAIQLLLSLIKQAEADNKTVKITSSSEKLKQVLNLLDIEQNIVLN